LQINKKDLYFVIGVSFVFCALSAVFSFAGMFLQPKIILVNPITSGSLNVKEVVGHFIWGLAAGTATLRLKYVLLGGTFAVLIDSDHLVNLLQVEGLPRMSHSIVFATISAIAMMAIFGRRDYILGMIAATSVLTHMSYDIFNDQYGFPLFTPFLNRLISFPTYDWIFFEVMAVLTIAIASYFAREN
jgi:LexA-binding, inner membrane-associated putative hydrolase